MPFKIADVQALEILDSRARPTLSVTLSLADGTRARAGVPSGASTGSGEAVELRDGDPHRYGGAGVTRAVGNVNGEISEALRDRVFETLADLDQLLIELDGTANKARLGANAIVGVSVAAARAIALHRDIPLWQHLTPDGVTPRLPVPHFNVLNGGAHAANRLDFQEFMIAPLGAPTLTEAVRTGAEVYTALRRNLATAGHNTGLGDEGGFAPEIAEPEYALRLLVAAIRDAGYEPGTSGVAIALDPAATGFRQPDGTYLINGQTHTTD
jgi:enolase